MVAYGSESPALAVLEVLVHLQSSNTLKSFSLARADVPDDLVEVFGPNELPLNWKQSPPPAEAQAVGDAWICERRSAALRVPSAVVDLAYNYLLNPAHADFAKIEIREPRPFTLNARLLGPE